MFRTILRHTVIPFLWLNDKWKTQHNYHEINIPSSLTKRDSRMFFKRTAQNSMVTKRDHKHTVLTTTTTTTLFLVISFWNRSSNWRSLILWQPRVTERTKMVAEVRAWETWEEGLRCTNSKKGIVFSCILMYPTKVSFNLISQILDFVTQACSEKWTGSTSFTTVVVEHSLWRFERTSFLS